MRSWNLHIGAANFHYWSYANRGSVYFVERPADGCIKIGFARHLRTRLDELNKAAGETLRFLGAIRGTKRLEREIHEWFAASRLTAQSGGREWFRPCDDLHSWIGVFATPTPPPPSRSYIRRAPARMATPPRPQLQRMA